MEVPPFAGVAPFLPNVSPSQPIAPAPAQTALAGSPVDLFQIAEAPIQTRFPDPGPVVPGSFQPPVNTGAFQALLAALRSWW